VERQEATLIDIGRPRAAGAALIASGGIFFTAELIAAAAWTDPPHSYTHHSP
jgi:hypothetical protein